MDSKAKAREICESLLLRIASYEVWGAWLDETLVAALDEAKREGIAHAEASMLRAAAKDDEERAALRARVEELEAEKAALYAKLNEDIDLACKTRSEAIAERDAYRNRW